MGRVPVGGWVAKGVDERIKLAQKLEQLPVEIGLDVPEDLLTVNSANLIGLSS